MDWSEWRHFPDPRARGVLVAPFGPGCYELRHGKQLLLFGSSENLAMRMSSLLPPPWGAGNRDNVEKREYVLKHLPEIEYRTCACDDRAAATLLEDELKANRDAYLFHERRRLVATRLRHGH